MRGLPENETREHFLIKQVGMIWLKHMGCQYVATEIEGMCGHRDPDRTWRYAKRYSWKEDRHRTVREEHWRSIADVVGVKRSWTGEAFSYDVRLIDVKVSRADFQAGYCTGADLVYIMTPPGLVSSEQLHTGVGLLEVDPERIAPSWDAKNLALLVRMVRRPTRQKGQDTDGAQVVERIAARYTNEAVYKNQWLIRGK